MKYGPLGRSGLIVSRICLGHNSLLANGLLFWTMRHPARATAYSTRLLDAAITSLGPPPGI